MFKPYLYSIVAAACMVVASNVTAELSTVSDPALSSWVKQVLAQNPEVQAAQAAVEAAEGRFRAADQPLFNPEVEFDYENADVDTTTGGISQTIDWGDKRGARAAVADSGQVATKAELRSTRQNLASDLLRALADWHTADAVVRLSEKQMALMTRFARIAQQRRDAGDLSQVELDLAHLAAAAAAFQQANANESLIQSRQAVTTLTGVMGAQWPQFSQALPDIDPRQVNVDQLLADLPLMQIALARVAAGRAEIKLSIRQKRPNPTIGVRAGKEDSDTLVGLTLSIPLFVRNNFRAEVDVANAELIRAEREAAGLRQQAHADLVAAEQGYRNARGAWAAWQASGAPRLNQRTDLLGRLWQAGELNTTDYLVQLKQSLETEVGATEQRGRMWRAWANWLAASGQADQWLNLTGDIK